MSKFEDLKAPIQKTGLKVLSLFSGIGGIDLGFQKAGFEVVATLDFDHKTCVTLEANRGKWVSKNTKIVEADITTINPRDLYDGKIDFVIGGPPCQTFSAIGRRAGGAMGTKDARGELFQHYCRLLEYYKPQGFLFENVRGILYANKGKDWQNVQNAFRNLGYDLKYRVMDTAGFGVAQHRERVILVGYKKGNFFFPRPTHGPDSLSKSPFVSAEEAIRGLNPSVEEGLALNGSKYDHLLPAVPPGMNYLFYTKKMGHPNPIFAWRSKFSDFLYKADPKNATKTLVAKMGRYSGPFHWDNRRLSSLELKRLQGFPDNFVITGSRNENVMQIGNSVVPHLAYYLALAVRKNIFNIKTKIDLLEDDYKLSMDSRKGDKASLTRIKTKENKKRRLLLKNGAITTISTEKRVRLLPTHGYISYDHGKVNVITHSTELMLWSVSFKYSGDKVEAFLEREQKVDEVVEPGSLELIITINDDTLKVRKIKVNLLTVIPDELSVIWDVVNYVISKTSSYPSIHELYGHFTEPDPQFSMKLVNKTNSNSPLVKLFIWSTDFVRVNQLFLLETLSHMGFDISNERRLVSDLRAKRFDIRTNLTNKQIPERQFRVCYPYTQPYERRSFVTIKG